jgi:ABC-type uncharacterized transport system involved in gliding motility auxiliary subunit
MALQVCLVLIVLGELVYLAGNYRLRADLTEDGLYSLTESTQRVLAGLEERLLIEAYFSPDAELPTSFREPREMLRNLLDEYVQSSQGKIILQYFDPKTDASLRERATRIGIEPDQTRNDEMGGVSLQELWQGFRLRYGGNRQKVIPRIDFRAASTTSGYERLLTPVIKSLTVTVKPRIGVLAYPSPPADQVGLLNAEDLEVERGFDVLQEWPQVSDHYDFVKVSINVGEHIPDNLAALLLIRPKLLSDRQKYVIDQYLMKGGKLVIFADTDDYSLGRQKLMYQREMKYDDAAVREKFTDQLLSYGVKVGTDVVMDAAPDAKVPMILTIPVGQRLQGLPLESYPYWFHPVDTDWAEQAELAARKPDGKVDPQLADRYSRLFKPGLDPEISKSLGAPEMFWPCKVELADSMPPGVEGSVLMRTSPWAMEVEPPFKMHPATNQADVRFIQTAINSFATKWKNMLASEPRRQIGLMAEVRGSFTSFFAGKSMPLPEGEYRGEEEGSKLIREDQSQEDTTVPLNPKAGDPDTPDDQQGPPAPATPALDTDSYSDEPDMILKSAEGAQLVVIGDTDFIRDDLIGRLYVNVGGPTSVRTAPIFFANLLDWLAGDQDLFQLRSKVGKVRALELLEYDPMQGGTIQEHSEEVRDKGFLLRTMVQVFAPTVLLVWGLVVLLRRRAAKRQFLSGVGA